MSPSVPMPQSQRPLSPHLQVYRLPFTALLSITHRLTGLALSLGAVLLIGLLLAAAAGPESYAPVHALARSWAGQAVLLAFTFALYFHMANGVRHLFWDVGYGFELATADKTGIAVVVVALALTAMTWLLTWLP